jgi:1,4-dihydroxy-2-naphthoyl-CoA synthase
MTKSGSNKMKIKIKTDTGKLDKLTDENNNTATEMTPEEIEQMYQDGPQHVGTILFTHSSPGCVVYCSGGRCYRVCR